MYTYIYIHTWIQLKHPKTVFEKKTQNKQTKKSQTNCISLDFPLTYRSQSSTSWKGKAGIIEIDWDHRKLIPTKHHLSQRLLACGVKGEGNSRNKYNMNFRYPITSVSNLKLIISRTLWIPLNSILGYPWTSGFMTGNVLSWGGWLIYSG